MATTGHLKGVAQVFGLRLHRPAGLAAVARLLPAAHADARPQGAHLGRVDLEHVLRRRHHAPALHAHQRGRRAKPRVAAARSPRIATVNPEESIHAQAEIRHRHRLDQRHRPRHRPRLRRAGRRRHAQRLRQRRRDRVHARRAAAPVRRQGALLGRRHEPARADPRDGRAGAAPSSARSTSSSTTPASSTSRRSRSSPTRSGTRCSRSTCRRPST